MKVTMLATTCDIKDFPTIYATDRGTLLFRVFELDGGVAVTGSLAGHTA